METLAAVKEFSNYIFWDVDRGDIDFVENAPYVIQRVLEYGQITDWNALLKLYGLPKIVEVSKGLRTLEDRALSFISTISQTPESEFRCYIIRQSNPQHLAF